MQAFTRITGQLADSLLGAGFTPFRCATGLRYVPFRTQFNMTKQTGEYSRSRTSLQPRLKLAQQAMWSRTLVAIV
jgi:hypothetical protein